MNSRKKEGQSHKMARGDGGGNGSRMTGRDFAGPRVGGPRFAESRGVHGHEHGDRGRFAERHEHSDRDTERSGTTAATGSSTGALRSATTTTTLTAFITVIAYLGTVFRSGFTVPITPTTIVGGCADRPSLRGVRIGGAAITTASAITKPSQIKKAPQEAGLFYGLIGNFGGGEPC